MTDLALRPAVELVAALQKGDVGARELLDHYLARVERLNPALNAVVTLDVERARHGRRRRRRGARPRQSPRPAARPADDDQGHARDRRAPHDRRRADARGARAGARRDGGRARARRGRGDLRQDQHAALRRRRADLQPGLRRHQQSLGSRAHVRRVVGRLGGRGGGRARGARRSAATSAARSAPRRTAAASTATSRRTASSRSRGHIPGPPGTLGEYDLGVMGPLGRSADDLALLLDVLAGPDDAEATAWRLALPPPRRQRAPRLSRRGLARRSVRAGRRRGAGARRGDGRGAARRRRRGRRDGAARPRPRRGASLLREAALADPLGRPDARRGRRAGARRRRRARPTTRTSSTASAAPSRSGARDWIVVDEERQQLRRAWADFFTRYDVLLCPIWPVPAIPHDARGHDPRPHHHGERRRALVHRADRVGRPGDDGAAAGDVGAGRRGPRRGCRSGCRSSARISRTVRPSTSRAGSAR